MSLIQDIFVNTINYQLSTLPLFRFTTTDSDSWFKTREMQHEDLKKQMETLQKDILSMKQQKMTLFVSTTAFRRNLLDLLGDFYSQ